MRAQEVSWLSMAWWFLRREDWATAISLETDGAFLWSILGPVAGARRNMQRRRGHEVTLRLCQRAVGSFETRRPGSHDGTAATHRSNIEAG